MAEKVRDLRSALALLERMPDQLIETDVEVDPMAELAGVYRYVGAGGTVKRPTKEGPAMIFNHVKGHPDAKVAIGLLASRKRVAALLDTQPENLGKMLCKSVENPVPPIDFEGDAPCQQVIHKATDPDFESYLIMSSSAELTLRQETELEVNDVKRLADHVCAPEEIGAKPASGSFKTEGMLIVPCSMKTIAGIHSGYADNLILRAADVTIKEQRTLVLAARETPLSGIHLRNLYELSMLPGVRIIPPMMTFYHKPESIDDMVYHIAAKLLEPFGIEAKEYRRWNGL